MVPPHRRPALGLHNEFSWGEMEQEVGLCRWWAVQEPILTGSVKTTPPLNHPVGHGSQRLLSAASFHSELFCFVGTLWLVIAFNDN